MIAIVSAARRLSNLATAMLDLQADGVSGGDANDLGSPEFQRRVASNARGFMAAAEIEAMSEKDLGKRIKLLEKQMLEHARNLEFEKAAGVRDQLAHLKAQVFGAAGEDRVA